MRALKSFSQKRHYRITTRTCSRLCPSHIDGVEPHVCTPESRKKNIDYTPTPYARNTWAGGILYSCKPVSNDKLDFLEYAQHCHRTYQSRVPGTLQVVFTENFRPSGVHSWPRHATGTAAVTTRSTAPKQRQLNSEHNVKRGAPCSSQSAHSAASKPFPSYTGMQHSETNRAVESSSSRTF